MSTAPKGARKSARSAAATGRNSKGFTDEERAAMKARVQEMKGGADGETVVLAKIDTMPEPDRSMGRRVHKIIMAAAPDLTPRLWYGMPAYAKDGDIVCHFQNAAKFKTRYATLGFSDNANLDDGSIWPVAYALSSLTAEDEAKIAALVKRAVG